MFTTTGYCFDDVLLVPKRSQIKSRDDVDLSVQLPKGISLKIPLVSSNMRDVTGIRMAQVIAGLGGLPILHRFDDYNVLVKNFESVISSLSDLCAVGASVGIKEEDKILVRALVNVGCKIICVDVAHGDHDMVCDFVSYISDKYPDVLIIAGNVVTESGAYHLWSAGADIIKIGIGGGSLCSTRIETGNGYPQLSALKNVCNGIYPDRNGEFPLFIADGGIRSAGDCVKSLVFADMVMIGNLFAGTDEAPGEIITQFLAGGKAQKFKQYAGSSTHKLNHIEGVVALVPYKGTVVDIVKKLVEGIRSGCSYQGVSNLVDLKYNPEFVVISNAGLKESHPHSVIL